jgi:single-strand DNA-binding protein
MNVVIIRGRLSSTPASRTLASGSELLSLEVTTVTPDGTASVPVAWFDPPASISFTLGDEVVVRGVVKRRFFRTGAGTQSRTEIVAAEIVAATRRRQVERLVAKAVDAIVGEPNVSPAC